MEDQGFEGKSPDPNKMDLQSTDRSARQNIDNYFPTFEFSYPEYTFTQTDLSHDSAIQVEPCEPAPKPFPGFPPGQSRDPTDSESLLQYHLDGLATALAKAEPKHLPAIRSSLISLLAQVEEKQPQNNISHLMPFLPPPEREISSNPSIHTYICRLCQTGTQKQFRTLGAFKRHISTAHFPKYEFNCPYDCGWCTIRKDKLNDHIRSVHRATKRIDLQVMQKNGKLLPPPGRCSICSKEVGSWKEFLHCVAEHCRVPIDNGPQPLVEKTTERHSMPKPFSLPEEIDFTDSGYGSVVNQFKVQASQAESNIQRSVDAETIYSGGSSLSGTVKGDYISELVGELYKVVEPLQADAKTLERLVSALPELLKSFALSLGGPSSTQKHRDVMVFIHKHR
ncbi:hypothetical protein ASPZODRAFT_509570 [Penicilliopsis zonata CBS 506.65]|uniref:C2H2-type domain-containing protein n=1 Tax=Penicilliopsis zonata CBS 506.65 TaxID=1073090 RepID=A0A1L9SEV1_9EURO|nr:hypothetical protein ASPZODRAFT_509570 [Penicilliopsis zonata CBS 506.65]OJJ45678.1 hypothetical protein ASPZODRAFT_509570 [Penicilliopsis zonata CBS 506.65]